MAMRRGPTARPAAPASRGPGPASGAPGDSPENALTITAFNTALKDMLEGMLPPVWVSGEVSQFKQHQNGHWYFSLKDAAGAVLDCVIWGSEKGRFPMAPDVGMQVFARGQLTIWAKQPRIQFRVSAMEDQGEGIWRRAYEKTKAALEQDGLLDPARKRPIPRFPRTIALITSPSGAAMHDIVSVVGRRYPAVDIVVIPAAVQGDTAPASLVEALGRAAAWQGADVLIIGRGGGSREDLWCFNDEAVCRAIAVSPIPSISAVGHETDFSIADLVADARAPTPSAAAELATPVLADLQADLVAMRNGMVAALGRRARDGRRRLDGAGTRIGNAVRRRAGDARRELQVVARTLRDRALRLAERRRVRLTSLANHIQLLSPFATLDRGYALARDPAGRVLAGVAQFAPGAPFVLKVRDGEVEATTTHVRPTGTA
jgi:exodeoxyribonuclease VII large subunit